MSAKKQTRNKRIYQPSSDFQRLSRHFMSGLLRSLFFINKSARYNQAGFVLPTTVLLLLITTLTIGALSYRTANRTQSTFLMREQQEISEDARPAIDRAKAKLEYLLDREKETRLPRSSTPSSDELAALMANVTDDKLGITEQDYDFYTLPDETRIDINGDGTLDNAWTFSPNPISSSNTTTGNLYNQTEETEANSDEDSSPDEDLTIRSSLNSDRDGIVIAYSVLMDDALETSNNREDDIRVEDALSQNKADALVTRNGPINADSIQAREGCAVATVDDENGWYRTDTALLEKNFQITAYVSNRKGGNVSNDALEMQQIRQASKGNRWGSWFKYDLEMFPGPEFNFNGAMHTDGNLMVDRRSNLHMISSHNSCLYTQDASAIALAQVDNDGDDNFDPTSGDFIGQLVVGNTTTNKIDKDRDQPRIHIYDGARKPLIDGKDTELTVDTDSVDADKKVSPSDISLDPLALFTRNISKHRRTDTWKRDADWENRKYFTGGRVFNQNQKPPYLDDFYRADNRYGPRPSYDIMNWVEGTDDGAITDIRTSPNYDRKLGETILESDPDGDDLPDVDGNDLINETSGLDGYWERQAGSHGLRLVVGQRLELGNRYGWKGNDDPLYPPNKSTSNLQRQRRTLRDNLAAVQGMVVYHYESNGGNYPLACYAATSHPGTLQTLRNSRNFRAETFRNSSDRNVSLISNFLTGKGTNGWEYDFPSRFRSAGGANDSFGAALADNKPLGIALRNLAYFAGDPKGGSPSFSPVQDGDVHPSPYMAMWGDYSVLRRIFDDYLDNASWKSSLSMASRFEALSPADRSSLHSAACTMGLLSNSLTGLDQLDWNATVKAGTFSGISNQGQVMKQVGKPVWDAFGVTNSGPGAGSFAEKYCKRPVSGVFANKVAKKDKEDKKDKDDKEDKKDNKNSYDCTGANLSKEEIIAAAKLSPGAINFIESLSSFTQIDRDRTYGFGGSPSSALPLLPWEVSIGNDTYLFSFPDDCHPGNENGRIKGLFNGNGGGLNDEKAGVALACATTSRYPALHYLFPKADHGQNDDQPATEEYISSTYILDNKGGNSPGNGTGVNREVVYRVVGDDNSDGKEEPDEQGMSAIAFDYRTNWKLPKSAGKSGQELNPETMQIVNIDGTLADVALLEKAMYNGREEMAIRVLDVDLGRLSKERNPNGSDYWISDAQTSSDQKLNNGVIYAAREDAVREDSIVRPAVGDWEDCDELTEIASFNSKSSMSNKCKMDASSNLPTDPPLTKRGDGSDVGISIKPINFAPDPDRRPYGFRLNADLNDNKGDISNNKERTHGLSFITDNAAYIKGNFNPHSANGEDSIEEFKQTLFRSNSKVNFYDGRKDFDDKFAISSKDRWRVAEILADAVTILSNNFVDGAIEEGFIRDYKEESPNFANSKTSFHNQQRPLKENDDKWGDADDWVREDTDQAHDSAAPVWVGRNGESATDDRIFDEATKDDDFAIRIGKKTDKLNDMLISVGADHRVNATIISGIIPSREKQGYGGLHNFPRFLERWAGKNLFIQGAFLQLNFSTSSTAPFSFSAWNPGDYSEVTSDVIPYYDPPNRTWGYDVALLNASAGPIARRFVTLEAPRSEYYQELSGDDPYVVGLRCSVVPGKTKERSTPVFSNETDCAQLRQSKSSSTERSSSLQQPDNPQFQSDTTQL